MTNHVHLLVTPDHAHGVSTMMQRIGRNDVGYFNRTYRRTGTLWEGRFKASVVDSERCLRTCYRYVELNPVRAAIVVAPGDYARSIYASDAHGDPDPIVSPHASHRATTFDKWCTAYRELVGTAIGDDELDAIRRYLQQQRALGSTRFQVAIEAMAGRCATVRDRRRPRRMRDVPDT